MGINAKQYQTLMKPLNTTRVAKRSQGGKQLSYLESWDVRAHLIRVFGFGNFDIETLEYTNIGGREYLNGEKEMIEVIYSALVQLTLKDAEGNYIARYAEGAVGSASGPMTMLGDHHDNALKTAVSDATKRCAINLGTQFGLSLYDGGTTKEIIRGTLVVPEGVEVEDKKPNQDQMEALKKSLGATEIPEGAQA